MNARLPFLTPVLAIAMLGCADSVREAKTEERLSSTSTRGVMPPDALRSSADFASAKMAAPNAAPGGGEAAKAPAASARKIVYTADVDIVAEDFNKVADSVAKLVTECSGFVAETDMNGSTGGHRKAHWKVRVPIEKFERFLDAVVKLGELQRRQIHSQDVTEEFYDLTARVKNKKVEETRLIKHLEESTGKLKEILEVEKEISRVREEIERMEGRVRLLADLTDLTTVTITADERIGFVPTTAPTFGTRASRTLDGSVKAVRDFLEGLTLWVIAVVPWLPFWIVGLLIAWLLLRWTRRRLIPRLARIPWREPIV